MFYISMKLSIDNIGIPKNGQAKFQLRRIGLLYKPKSFVYCASQQERDVCITFQIL